MSTKTAWPEVDWRVRAEDAEILGWISTETVRVIVMRCCGFTFSAEHTDGDCNTYTCPLCEPKEIPDARKILEA